jgi:GA4 desaturase
MGSYEREDYGTVRFAVPDMSISAYDRALFTLPGNKSLQDVRVKLHDLRTSKDIVQGPAGLDKQGFTYVKHKSALSYDDWMKDGMVEDVYTEELKKLILEVTGAKDALIYCVSFRRRPAGEQGIGKVDLRGALIDQAVGCLPRDKCLSMRSELRCEVL